jgi:hypothetical protein
MSVYPRKRTFTARPIFDYYFELEKDHRRQMKKRPDVRRKKRANAVIMRELIVPATEKELNHALSQHKVRPDRILSIMDPESTMAGGIGPQYRVIYRA